jgi:hypothetical protein
MAMTEEERRDVWELQDITAGSLGELGSITEVMALVLSFLAEDAAVRARLLDFLEEAIARSQAALSETNHPGIQLAQEGSVHVLNTFVNAIKKGGNLPS